MLAALSGGRFRLQPRWLLPSTSHYERAPGRREFVPARLTSLAMGTGLELVAKAGSARLKPLLDADGFAELPEGAACIAPGDLVPFHPFRGAFSARDSGRAP